MIESGAFQVNPNIHDYIARSPEWRAEMGGDQKSVDESIYKIWKLFCANELPGGTTQRYNMSKLTMENRKRKFEEILESDPLDQLVIRLLNEYGNHHQAKIPRIAGANLR